MRSTPYSDAIGGGGKEPYWRWSVRARYSDPANGTIEGEVELGQEVRRR